VLQTASVILIDSKELADNVSARTSLAETAATNVAQDLSAWFVSYLNSTESSVSGVTGSYANYLTNEQGVSDLQAWVSTYISDKTPAFTQLTDSFVDALDEDVDGFVAADGTGSDLAIAVTKVMTGVKYIDYGTILNGQAINDDGSLAVTQEVLGTTIESAIASASSLVADTIGDPLGNDTRSNFPDANIIILTTGDDDESGTTGSDLIASLSGADTVDGLAGNDKLLGGTGVDTLLGGAGNDHLYGFAANDTLTGGEGNDKLVGGLGDDTISGGPGDDEIQAQTGDDTISSGTGTDTLLGGLGDDAITIDGAGDKTVNGGPGTDSLTINYGSINRLGDFTVAVSGDYTSLTDADGNVILYKSIETLVVGDNSYVGVYGGLATNGATFNTSGMYYDPASNNGSVFKPESPLTNLNFGNNIISSADFDATNNEVYLYGYGEGNGSHLTVSSLSSLGYTGGDLTVYGTEFNDLISAGFSMAGDPTITIYGYDGFDVIDLSGRVGSGDTVDAGAGDDIVYVSYSDYASDVLLDGGAGTDTLFFTSTSSAITYTLNTSPTTNFETVYASSGDDSLTGDTGDNRLVGYMGSDTLTGGAGDDELYGHFPGVGSPPLYGDGTDSNDALYGGAGNDALYGGAGDDILDGGTGRDVLSGEGSASGDGSTYSDESQELWGGPAGSDTFVTRAGDGSTVLAQADVITDFQDGTDQIGLDGISFNELTIEQGSGDYVNDTLVSITTSAEYLLVIQNTTASDITYLDMVSNSTDPLTLSGTSSDEVLLGGSGSDTIASGTGTDILVGYSGDDAITIDGAGDKTVDGGPGTDSLTISYGSITSMSDFTVGVSGDYTSLTDADGNVILYKNIETLVVGANSYVGVYAGLATNDETFNTSGMYYDPAGGVGSLIGGSFEAYMDFQDLNFGNNIISSTYFDATNNEAYLYGYGEGNGSHLTVSSLSSLGYTNGDLTVYGTQFNDLIAGGSSFGAPGEEDAAGLTVYGYGGFDIIDMSQRTGNDTVDAGSGDDIVYVNYSDYANDTLLDGGAGTDTLFFTSTSSAITYTLNTSPTTNFETVYASSGDDSLVGDTGDNRLVGYMGADTLTGGAGDDELYGHFPAVGSPMLYEGGVDGDDTLYGGEGDDSLYGGAGDDILDGGVGRDVLTGEGPATSDGSTGQALLGGPAGSDTFVTRAGDGSTVLAQADVITDFQDGTDQIGLDGISFNELTIEQGSGDYVNDTLVSITTSAEYLLVIQNTTASDITYLDMVSNSTDPLTLSGTSSDEVLLGGSGSDTIASGTGTDILVGYSGDDAITIDGAGDKTVDGGPGTDSLTISYGSITSMSDFTVGVSGDYTSLTDADGNVILYKNIETLVVGGNSYVGVYGGLATNGATFNTSGMYYDPASNNGSVFKPESPLTNLNFGNNIISSAYFDATNNEAYLYGYGEGNGSHLTVSSLSSLGYTGGDLTVYGTEFNDLISAGFSMAGDPTITIYGYDGFDVIDLSGRVGSGDTVDAGAGDDIVYVNYSDYANDTLLDGGAGTDTLFFTSTSSAITYTLNTSPTTNFETVYASSGDDSLVGDTGDNRLVGYMGADTLTGGAGDDELYGHFPAVGSPMLYEGGVDGDDTLYGGEGDDSLYGGAGDDILDGGVGRDVLTGEGPATSDGSTGQALLGGPAGSDTFVTRAGDGSTVLAQADVITDFQDGTDQIGMDGFEFTDLTIEAGSVYSEQCAADTIVRRGVEFLFVVQQVQSSDLTDVDFTPYTSSVLQSSSESGDSASYTISDACSGAGGSVGGSSKPQIETIKASPELGIAGTRWVLNPIPGAITSGVSEFDSSRYRMTEKVLASQDCGFVEEFHFNTDGTFEIVRKAKVVAADMARSECRLLWLGWSGGDLARCNLCLR
jgi:Ca2+-binding RTX toxin-like protein